MTPSPMTPTRITSIRKSLGLTKTDFASYCNVSRQTVHGWESGGKSPDGPSVRLLEILEERNAHDSGCPCKSS